MNNIFTIFPYRSHGIWCFDDPQRGLLKEPFVCGMNEIIDFATKDIPNAESGVRFLFSDIAFPSANGLLEWIEPANGGNWYKCANSGLTGWLCPAMFKFFNETPPKIFFQVC